MNTEISLNMVATQQHFLESNMPSTHELEAAESNIVTTITPSWHLNKPKVFLEDIAKPQNLYVQQQQQHGVQDDEDVLQREKQLRQQLNDVSKTLDGLKRKLDSLMDDPEKQELKAFRDKLGKIKKRLIEMNQAIAEREKNDSSVKYDSLQTQLEMLKQEIKASTEHKERQSMEKKEIEESLKVLVRITTLLSHILETTSGRTQDKTAIHFIGRL
jgi:regulator of replication initiation timing